MVWLDLPSGPNYNEDLPFANQYFAGYMEGENSGPNFTEALEELMNYVDNNYKFIEPHIKK